MFLLLCLSLYFYVQGQYHAKGAVLKHLHDLARGRGVRGEGRGVGLIIVTLCTTTLWIYCVCIHCCQIALWSLFRGGICSDFSFQNIKLCVFKAERINVNRMNYRITHGTRVCISFSFLHLSRTWHPQYVTSEQGWTNCTVIRHRWTTLLLGILLKCFNTSPLHYVKYYYKLCVCVCVCVCGCVRACVNVSRLHSWLPWRSQTLAYPVWISSKVSSVFQRDVATLR